MILTGDRPKDDILTEMRFFIPNKEDKDKKDAKEDGEEKKELVENDEAKAVS